MANLKIDLANKLNNDKYFAEMELIRLAQEPNMNYKEKIEEMNFQLEMISASNSKIQLVDQYFNKPEIEAQNSTTSNPTPNPTPLQQPSQSGPSHTE